MYERFYGLRERPFSLSPDPDYLYLSRAHREALGYIRYGIEGQSGFIVLTGEIGCGKTTLLQTVVGGLDPNTSVARLVSTMLDPRELVEAIMLDFGLDPSGGRSKPQLIRELGHFLVEQRSAGRLPLLAVDEAQNLSASALEELRMLSNLETEKSKLIQVLLVGQPSLRNLLERPELEQLRQRVTVSYHLEPLDAGETEAYINHRLSRAALGEPLVFSRDVTDAIWSHSRGIPRRINVIADAILLFGYGESKKDIDTELTAIVLEELEATGVLSGQASKTIPLAAEPPRPPTSSERDLAAREALLSAREQLLRAQRQVLANEYRLLRELHPGAADFADDPPLEPRGSWPPRAADADDFNQPGVGRDAVPGGDESFDLIGHGGGPPESRWQRLRRGLGGRAKPA